MIVPDLLLEFRRRHCVGSFRGTKNNKNDSMHRVVAGIHRNGGSWYRIVVVLIDVAVVVMVVVV